MLVLFLMMVNKYPLKLGFILIILIQNKLKLSDLFQAILVFTLINC